MGYLKAKVGGLQAKVEIYLVPMPDARYPAAGNPNSIPSAFQVSDIARLCSCSCCSVGGLPEGELVPGRL